MARMAPTLNAYNLKTEKLLADLENSVNDDNKMELLDAFSKDYLLLPNLWKMRIELGMTNSYPKIVLKLIKRAFFDFYSVTLFSSLQNENAEFYTRLFQIKEEPFKRTLKWDNLESVILDCKYTHIEAARKLLIEYISFPHSKLDDVLSFAKLLLCEPMSLKLKKTFRTSKSLYEKILTLNDDIEKWFKFVISTKNDKFIIQNVECRIANEPENFQLWKMFIEYLGGKKHKAMLQVVYRYKRLFIDDNSFDLKISSSYEKLASLQYFQSAKYSKFKIFEKSVKKSIITPCLYYYKAPIIHQMFSLPSPIIRYMTKKATTDVLQSLYQTCKYFFDKRRQPLCYYASNFPTPDIDIKYHKNRMDIKNPNSIQLQNVCLTTALKWVGPMISEFLSKLSESHLRYLYMKVGSLSFLEYEFLTKSGKVEYICIFCTKITVDGKEGSAPIILENLFKNLPKAKHIEFNFDTVNTPKTSEILLNLERKNKFNLFSLIVQRFTFNAQTFVKFLEKNANPFAKISLTLKDITDEEREVFVKEVETELLRTNNEEYFKPLIYRMVN